MRQLETLFFGPAIKKKKRKRIKKQLNTEVRRERSPLLALLMKFSNSKKEYQLIIIRIGLKTLLELISYDEYTLLVHNKKEFVLIGAVESTNEFQTFVTDTVTRVLADGNIISQETILKTLEGADHGNH